MHESVRWAELMNALTEMVVHCRADDTEPHINLVTNWVVQVDCTDPVVTASALAVALLLAMYFMENPKSLRDTNAHAIVTLGRGEADACAQCRTLYYTST